MPLSSKLVWNRLAAAEVVFTRATRFKDVMVPRLPTYLGTTDSGAT